MIKYISEEHFKRNSFYYDYQPIDSFGCKTKLIVGARGIGKTFGVKRKVNKKFYYNKQKFIWLRDTESACDKMREANGIAFFSDIKKEVFKHDFEGAILGEEIIINDELAGRLMSNSTFYNYKGNAFTSDDFTTIVFDEFIPEDSQVVRGNRTRMFLNMVETLGRLRTDYDIYLLANALNRGDEILQMLGFTNVDAYGYYINREQDAVLHYASNDPNFEKAKNQSTAGKLLMNSAYHEIMTKNTFLDDKNLYFDKKPAGAKVLCIISDGIESVRVYFANDELFYVDKDINYTAYGDMRYVCDIKNIDSKHRLINPELYKVLKEVHSNGNIKFANAYIKNLFLRILLKQK